MWGNVSGILSVLYDKTDARLKERTGTIKSSSLFLILKWQKKKLSCHMTYMGTILFATVQFLIE